MNKKKSCGFSQAPKNLMDSKHSPSGERATSLIRLITCHSSIELSSDDKHDLLYHLDHLDFSHKDPESIYTMTIGVGNMDVTVMISSVEHIDPKESTSSGGLMWTTHRRVERNTKKKESPDQKLTEWREAYNYLAHKYTDTTTDAEYAQHMKKLDPLMHGYFKTPTNTHTEGYFDLLTEEWVDTTLILKESQNERLTIDTCQCCQKPLVVQQDMVWVCWYCSPKNNSVWKHNCCTP